MTTPRRYCTCRLSSVNSASLEPPHEILDPWCPLHGRDPDDELELRRERAGIYEDRDLYDDPVDRLIEEDDECA